MKKIAWYSRFSPIDRQLRELERLYGEDMELFDRGQPSNSSETVRDFRNTGAHECVVVAPMAVLAKLVEEGIRPLWAEMILCEGNHPQAEVHLPNDRHFRFDRFRRLVAMELVYKDRLTAQPGESSKVLWFSKHTPQASSRTAVHQLYGADCVVDHRSGDLVSAEQIQADMRRARARDMVLVAPLSVFGDLVRQKVYPIQVRLEEGRQVLRRVTSLRQLFEEI